MTSPSRNASAASSIRAGSTAALLNPARRSFLDESALSPQEYIVYLSSFASIKPAPSGQPDLIDEQDGLRYLREECGMSMADELEILPLFERTPLGLASGHFFAMLRLVSWAQQGKSATKDLIFTQTKPVRIAPPNKISTPQSASAATFGNVQQIASPGPRSLTAGPPPLVSASAPPPKIPPPKPESSTKPLLTPVREESAITLNEQPDSPQGAFKPPPAVPAKPQMPKLVAPKPKVANPNIPLNLEQLQRKPVPIPPSSSANPFRDGATSTTGYASGSGYAVAVGAASTLPTNISTPSGALLGFDPAPNPFKQNKPRIVKPTPVRASSPASNPFRNGTPVMAAQSHFPKVVFDPADDASSQASSSRSRQQHQADRLGASSPPLPPRPGERNPPPLPPRHISPLIQAGLNARSEVRRAKESLPPKTFTVLQSSTAKHGGHPPAKPRLLNGQTAPPEVAAVTSHGKRRSVSGTKSILGSSSALGHPLQRRDSEQSASDLGRNDTELGTTARRTSSQLQRGIGGDSEVGAGNSTVSHGVLHQQQQRTVPTVAPKPIYAKKAGLASGGGDESTSISKVKATLPSWLKEQEELQREALASGSEPPPPPPIQPTEGGVRGRASRTVVDELTDSAEAMSDEAAAANAASIDRHNPFFPPHRRDEGRSPHPSTGAGGEVEGRDDSQVSSNRPLGRSKTMGASANRPPPPRRPRPLGADGADVGDENGSAVSSANAHWGHSLESGTYAGFKPNKEPKNSGGLRLVPPSKQAKMLNIANAERLEQEGIRPAQDLRKTSFTTISQDDPNAASQGGGGANSENSSGNGGPMSPTTPSGNYPTSHQIQPSGLMRRQGSLGSTIREKVSDILRLQDQPPKGQRQVDLLTQDLNNFVNKNEWLARKRDSFVRSTSGNAARERERLINSSEEDRINGRGEVEEEAVEEEDDGPHPDTDPSQDFRRHSMQHQRRISGSGGNRDPFSSPPPKPHSPSVVQLHQQEHNPHLHQPPPQHPATTKQFDPSTGLRRSGSLNPKRSNSYNYPAGAPSPPNTASTNPIAAAAAGAGAGRRWSSFHQPHNSFSQLQSHSSQFLNHHTQHGQSGGGGRRDLRGSAVDEEDADE